MRNLFRWLLRVLFRFETYNHAVLQTRGPLLLIPNHTSWVDWLFLAVCLDGDWRFVVSSRSAETSWLHRRIMLNRRTFPIDATSPYAVKRMAEHLKNNGRLVLFAEGRLSRTGALMKFFDGTGFLLFKTHARVVACYLRGAHRILFSPNNDLKQWFPRVTAHFSDVLDPPRLTHLTTAQARARLTQWLKEQMQSLQFATEMSFGPRNLPEAIVDSARRQPGRIALEDIQQPLTYRRMLVGAELLRVQWDKSLPRLPERVGVLMPNVNATPVVLLSLWLRGQVPAVLNYSTGVPTMVACAKLAGVSHIISSRNFIERARLNIKPLEDAGFQMVYLEDIRTRMPLVDKLGALLRISFSPGSVLGVGSRPEDPAVILFTSGSEGTPKGVELTHGNILANIRQMLAVADLQDDDRIFNCLPIFHSFGLTVGTLLSLVRGMYTFLYPSPLHYRVVPAALYDRDCTVFLSTNTFLNGYSRKADPYDFRSLRYLFAAAEKLQEATASVWSQRLGVRVLEGYGATECSPCLSVNTPLAPKHGSVGRLLPGIEYKLEKVEGVDEGGRLFVKGPNVMRGYLNPEANASFKALDGWYDTGDIVSVDDDGFLFIRGRLKRFAKVAGEMVSLTAVEEALAGAFPQYGLRCQLAVIARPGGDKGEVLIAVSNEPKLGLDEIRAVIKSKGLPNLFVPREVKHVREIPKLGTGKTNHRELENMLAKDA